MSQYRVLAQLAKGGMGEILLARKLGAAGFERLVVLKRPLHLARSAGTVRALVEEARLLAQIHHPNVCHVYDLEEAGGELFFVMEFLDGISLWQFLDEPGRAAPLPVPASCALFEQACDGLSAIHALGMVHRDISPSNVFATTAGVVKVLDLGIARPTADATGAASAGQVGQVKGKRTYCAPEQLAGGRVDARSDLFSLGLVMHDVALARRPSRDRIGADAVIDVAALPAELAAVIARAAARDPGDRFASAAELGAALRGVAARHGGLPGRAELAGWLTTRFAAPLARQRAVVDRAAAAASEDATTRVLELRPAMPPRAPQPDDRLPDPPLRVDRLPPVTEPLAPPRIDRLPPVTGPLAPSRIDRLLPASEPLAQPRIDRLPHATEQLDRMLRRSRPRRWAAGLLGIAALAAVAAAVFARSGDRRTADADFVRDGGTSTASEVPLAQRGAALATQRDGAAAAQRDTAAAPVAQRDGAAAQRERGAAPATAETHGRQRPAPSPMKLPHVRRAESSGTAAVAPAVFGAIRIDSQPVYATVDIDGQRVGVTPIKSWRLSAGRHRVHARRVDGKEQDVEVVIAADRQTNLPLSW